MPARHRVGVSLLNPPARERRWSLYDRLPRPRRSITSAAAARGQVRQLPQDRLQLRVPSCCGVRLTSAVSCRPARRIRSSPEVLEPARRQLGVSHRVLDVAVAEVSLQRSRIVALVGQRKATGVAQHVRMSRKAELGLDASALHHARKACRGERRAPLGL